MGAKIEVKNYDDIDTLRKEIRKAKDGRYQLRLRCILMRKKGASTREIEEELKIRRQSIARWVKKYNEGGKEALANIKPGNKKGRIKWDVEIFNALAKHISQTKGYWTVMRMQDWIKEKFGHTIPLETIRYHLHKLGFSHKSGRPSPYLGSWEAQKDFKKKG